MLSLKPMMSAGDVRAVLDRLAQVDITVWLDGGWGIDALVGEHFDQDGNGWQELGKGAWGLYPRDGLVGVSAANRGK